MKFANVLMAGQEENARRAIRSAMDTYQTPWKVLHESLQNALDAIYETQRDGQISVTVDVRNQSVSIRDDGIGFPQGEEGKRLLGLHGSGKPVESALSGNLGYGMKAVICSTKYFKLISRRDGRRWGFEITRGYDLDQAEFTELTAEPEEHAENGTELYYDFPNKEVTRFVNDLYASTPGIARLKTYRDTIDYLSDSDNSSAILRTLIVWYFRTSTYAANLDRLVRGDVAEVPRVQISFRIVGEDVEADGTDTLVEDVRDVLHLDGGVIAVSFENKYWDIEELFLDSEGRTKPGLPFTVSRNIDLPIPSTQELKTDQIAIFRFDSIEDYEKLIVYSNGRTPNPNRDAAYYRNKVFNSLKGIYVVVGRKRYLDHMLFPGMPYRQIAFARGVPTQDFIGLEPGMWESARSEYTIVFGPNVSDALNLGKLQLNYRQRIRWLREFYTDLFRVHLRNISSQVAQREITDPEDIPFPEDEEPPTDFVDRPKIFEAGTVERGLIVEPIYENELIALFFELIGRRDLNGYQFYGLSGYSRYDGKSEFKSLNREYFRSAIAQDSKLITVEFKVLLSGLVADLEKNRKRVSQIHLVVVWEADQSNFVNPNDYRLVSVDNYEAVSGAEYPHERRLPHVESILAVLQDGRWIPIQVVEVKKVVDRIQAS